MVVVVGRGLALGKVRRIVLFDVGFLMLEERSGRRRRTGEEEEEEFLQRIKRRPQCTSSCLLHSHQ